MTTDGRPRVFQFITRLLKGGAEDHLIDTVLDLEEYDFTVGHGASYDQKQIDRLQRNGVETEEFPLVRHYNAVTAIPAVVSVIRYLRQHDFDIVHTNSTEAGIIGRFAAATVGSSNVVHTVHGVPFADDRNAILNRFVLACERAAAHRTDRIITNADIMADKYLKRGIGTPQQYTTIYSGIHLDRFRDADPANDLPGTRPRVVMISRLADGKGFDVLLEAVEAIDAEELSVCLVGDGPLYDSVRTSIERRGLSNRVFLTGYREDVPRILAASDVLVLPSFREGTPRVITEAMASGLPVIATDIAGIPEQVADGESGYLIPPGDAHALADRLSELLSDPELREQMGRHGADQAQRFSVEAMRAATDELYSDLLSSSDG
ncbi:glycosyltransferase family 4 protein [Natronomonas amylolytica]|uniref:glycosyltransferase family 4 protein n=1 Tax=Natronomonas amylolytica TaxID=3108498 RepID=UPI00300A83C3